jgi:NADP-dependent 3-hydroxy acid dehydrogenase YdfG
MTESSRLTETVALITGASAGIGRATARAFAREGADIALAARREGRLEAEADHLEDAYGVETVVTPTDVSDENEVKTMVAETLDQFSRLDVVVCNAGIAREQVAIEEMTTKHYRQMMDVNVDGAFFTARETIPHLREQSGALIFVGSAAGQYPVASQPIYAASKWWLRGFALSIAGTMERDEVGVALINPSEVRTEITSPEGKSRKEQHDAGEIIEPEEVAEGILFAASLEQPTAVAQLDMYRRDMLDMF